MEKESNVLDEGMQQTGNEDILYLASAWKRLLNHIVDSIVVSIILYLIASIIELTLGIKILPTDQLSLAILIIVFQFSYYTVLEFLFGTTVGKVLTRTKVVTEDGEKAELGTILVRSLCRLIPLEFLSFLLPNAVGLHDLLSKTRVVEND